MIIAILATIIIFMGIFILVLIVGYGEQLRSMRMKANINAGLWAEAEAKAHGAEIQVAKLDATLKAKISTYEHMRHLAKEAIRASGQANGIEAFEEAALESDEILNATEIDN